VYLSAYNDLLVEDHPILRSASPFSYVALKYIYDYLATANDDNNLMFENFPNY
jgi:hypothetical protein